MAQIFWAIFILLAKILYGIMQIMFYVFDIYRGGNKMANIYEIRNNIKVTEEKLDRLYPQNNKESEIENLEEYLYGQKRLLRSLEMA